MNGIRKHYNFWTIFLIVFGILLLVAGSFGCSNKAHASDNPYDFGVWCASSGPGYGSWTVVNNSEINALAVIFPVGQPPASKSLAAGQVVENLNFQVDTVRVEMRFSDGITILQTATGDCTHNEAEAIGVNMPEADPNIVIPVVEESVVDLPSYPEPVVQATQNADNPGVYELPATGTDEVIAISIVSLLCVGIGVMLVSLSKQLRKDS